MNNYICPYCYKKILHNKLMLRNGVKRTKELDINKVTCPDCDTASPSELWNIEEKENEDD